MGDNSGVHSLIRFIVVEGIANEETCLSNCSSFEIEMSLKNVEGKGL